MSNPTPTASESSMSNTRALTPTPSSTGSGTPRFTPSPTPFTFGEDRPTTPSFTFGHDFDRDRPLPSVETDSSPRSTRHSTPSTTAYTQSTLTRADSDDQDQEEDNAVLQQIGHISDLRLASPQTPVGSASGGRPRTPSIHVTPSMPPNSSRQPQSTRADSLTGLVSGLRLGSPQPGLNRPAGSRQSRSPSASRSRSAIHQIECEDEPAELSELRAAQEALVNARVLTSRLMNALSSSNLHQERRSSINTLYQQATRLHDFQLPSSRVVGLVGDSGVGKSSLINSLLDKMELTRSVSDHAPLLMLSAD